MTKSFGVFSGVTSIFDLPQKAGKLPAKTGVSGDRCRASWEKILRDKISIPDLIFTEDDRKMGWRARTGQKRNEFLNVICKTTVL